MHPKSPTLEDPTKPLKMEKLHNPGTEAVEQKMQRG